MNKNITTHEELIDERKRLQALLVQQRNQIKYDLQELKEEINPALKIASVAGKFTKREDTSSPGLSLGTNLTIDYLASKALRRSNFLLKMTVPLVLKNFTSHYIPKAATFIQRVKSRWRTRQEEKRYSNINTAL